MTQTGLKNTVRWASIMLALAATGYFFREEIRSLYAVWQSEEYSHAFMLVPLAVLWGIASIQKSGAVLKQWSPGLAVFFAGLLMNILGIILVNTWISSIAIVIVLLGLCLACIGPQATRAAWMGFALLVFAVPIPPIVMAGMTAKLQLVSSWLGSGLLDAFSISIYREGNVLDLGTIRLQVAEACSGLRYFFPLFSLSFLAAFLVEFPLWIRLTVIASSMPITILMNAFRIATIGIAADLYGAEVAEGLVHDLEGWVVFGFCLLILGLEIYAFGRLKKIDTHFDTFLPSLETPFKTQKAPSLLLCLILLLTPVLATGGKGWLQQKRADYPVRYVSFDTFPLSLGTWKGRPDAIPQEQLGGLGLTSYFLANFDRERDNAPAETVNFYIAYYADQRLGAAPHSPKVCLPGDGWEMTLSDHYGIKVPASGKILYVNRAVIRKGTETRLVYFWLRERGEDVSSTLEVKWRLLLDAFKSGRSDGALIRIVAPVPDINRIGEQDALIQNFLTDVWPEINLFMPHG